MKNALGQQTVEDAARRHLLAAVGSALLAGAALPVSATSARARESGFVQTDHGRLRYERTGEGPPIVAIAGGPGTSLRSLGSVLDVLADSHTVIYFDNLGRGLSDELPPGARHSPARDAEDVEALRRALQLGPIAVFGHSYGGYPALAYAAAHGEHLSRLVLSSTGYRAASWQANIDNVARFVQTQYPDLWTKLAALIARGVKSSQAEFSALFDQVDIEALYWYDRSNQRLRTPPADPRERFRPAVYAAMLGDDPEVRVGGSLAGFDASATLAALRCPLLITSGRHDRIALPSVAAEMAALAPPRRTTWTVFERSGHFPWIEEPEAFGQTLRTFMTR